MSAANGETLVIVINRLLLRLDARGVSANEIVACIKPLIAESEAKALSSLAMVTAESADRNISLRLERDQLRTELALLREWQREVIQNANAHHAERKEAIARAERAEAELREMSAEKLRWSLLAINRGDEAQRAEAEHDATREQALSLAKELDEAQAKLADCRCVLSDHQKALRIMQGITTGIHAVRSGIETSFTRSH
jgi:hypothetical protein